MTDETRNAAAEDETSAAERAAGEADFADAGAPPADAGATEAPATPDEGATPADEAEKWRDVALRKQAEFENFRKRMARENALAAERGAGRLAKELLPALDHLELALKASAADEEVVKGFGLVRDELVAALERSGIQRFSPVGEPFDPNEHEAMAQQPSEEAEPGTILEVYQQGYRINGVVLRPARVVVAS